MSDIDNPEHNNYDRMIREVEQHDSNVLNSVVEDSRLERFIHNPVTEGIDES